MIRLRDLPPATRLGVSYLPLGVGLLLDLEHGGVDLLAVGE